MKRHPLWMTKLLEEPLEIRIEGRSIAVLMRQPIELKISNWSLVFY